MQKSNRENQNYMLRKIIIEIKLNSLKMTNETY